MKTKLIDGHEKYTDKYFLRANTILKGEGLNPWVRAQVFIRNGPGIVAGIDEALDIINEYSPLAQHGGRVYSLPDGSVYQPKDTLMVIEAPIQDIIELETIYLGIISAETTKLNDGHDVDLSKVRENMSRVVEAAQGRPVSYFGARHWRFDRDQEIARAAFEGGATSTSTDIGALVIGKEGLGTIPHALENVMAYYYGVENAVVEATKAFDKHIDRKVPRIALIDYANREIDDSLAVAMTLGNNLYGVRVDTCGENVAQGAIDGAKKYWEGHGVTITGVAALRNALDERGYQSVKIILSSGFGDVDKVKAFIEAEKRLGVKLFDSLGVGGVFKSRMSTMDIVAVGDDLENMVSMSKVGRAYQPNKNLELRLGGKK